MVPTRFAFLGLLLTCFQGLGISDTRRLWVFDQWAEPQMVTLPKVNRTSLSLGLTHLLDSVSSKASFLASFGFMEVQVRGAVRAFPNLTESGVLRESVLIDERHWAGVELGRYFVSDGMQFGRLGAEFIYTFPLGRRTLRLGLDTGILARASFPWSLHFSFSWFIRGPANSSYLCVYSEVGRVFEHKGAKYEVGGRLGWMYRTLDESPQGKYEHMMFPVGPTLSLIGNNSRLTLALLFRLWMDKEKGYNYDKQKPINEYPLDPYHLDLSASYSFFF